MTIKELLDKLSELINDENKDYQIVINGSHNWEYIDSFHIYENQKEFLIETRDVR